MGGGKIDILRLSHNVRRNLKKEEEESSGGQYGGSNSSAALNNQSEFSNFSRGQSAQNSAMAMGSAAALMMVGGNSNVVQNVVNEPVLQVGEDDINLNNRRVVLNFGEKGDDAADSDNSYKQGSDGATSAGSQTPSHHSSNNNMYPMTLH